jgi:hypothetical protein
LNWLGTLHAKGQQNTPLEINLRQFTSGFNSDAEYTVQNVSHGTAVLSNGDTTVHFTPEKDYIGLASFEFTLEDGDVISRHVSLLITAENN